MPAFRQNVCNQMKTEREYKQHALESKNRYRREPSQEHTITHACLVCPCKQAIKIAIDGSFAALTATIIF